MSKRELIPIKKAVVIDLNNYKLRGVAREYVRLLSEYGVESASLWSMEQLTTDNEKKLFKKFVKMEMRKFGFIGLV